MSESSVARNAMSFILGRMEDQETRNSLRIALDAARPGPTQGFWELAADAGHSNAHIRKLCTGLYFLFGWGNLTDDLADQECSYLEDPERMGPVVLFLLRCLADEYMLDEAGTPPQILARMYRLLGAGAALGMKELATRTWNAQKWIEIAKGIAGMQYQAYILFLWHSTKFAHLAEEVGLKLGLVSHYFHDVHSEDPRLLSIDPEGQAESERFIEEQYSSLELIAREHNIPSLTMLLSHLDWRKKHVPGY